LLHTPRVVHVVPRVPDRSRLRAEGGEALETVAAHGEVIRAVRACGTTAPCAEHVGGGLCRIGDARKRAHGRVEFCLLEMRLAREEAIKAVLAMGNSCGALCRRRES
jgi:hypothetical protein